MKPQLFLVVVALTVTWVVQADNLTYFDCQCYDGSVLVELSPSSCTCDCTDAGTATNGENYLSPFCAYPTTGVVQLTIVTNSSNTSEFSASRIEQKLKQLFSLSTSSTDISFSQIDTSSRTITNHFKPFITTIFNIASGTLASTMLNSAKTESSFNADWLPLGVWEVEPFYKVADDVDELSMAPQWIVLMIILIIVSIIESCIASTGAPGKVTPIID